MSGARVAVGTVELHLPDVGSLKGKRHVLKGLKEKLRHRFEISVAEVDHQDLWQRAALGITCAGESASHCRDVLSEIERFVARTAAGTAELTGSVHQVVSLEDVLP